MERISDEFVLILSAFLIGAVCGAWLLYALFKLRVLTPGKHPREEWPFPDACKAANGRPDERGSIFFAPFGAVAMVGVVGGAAMMVMKGPVKTMSDVSKRSLTESNLIASTRLAIGASATDCDADDFIEPLEPEDAGAD